MPQTLMGKSYMLQDAMHLMKSLSSWAAGLHQLVQLQNKCTNSLVAVGDSGNAPVAACCNGSYIV